MYVCESVWMFYFAEIVSIKDDYFQMQYSMQNMRIELHFFYLIIYTTSIWPLVMFGGKMTKSQKNPRVKSHYMYSCLSLSSQLWTLISLILSSVLIEQSYKIIPLKFFLKNVVQYIYDPPTPCCCIVLFGIMIMIFLYWHEKTNI